MFREPKEPTGDLGRLSGCELVARRFASQGGAILTYGSLVGGPDGAVVVLSFVLVVVVVTTAAFARTIKETASLDTSY